MKGILLLIFLVSYHPLFSMDDTNIFDIDSDELRELKQIAESLESPTSVIAQEQKKTYQKSTSTSSPKSKPESSPDVDKKTLGPQGKQITTYTCICGGVYYIEGWLQRHQKKCAIVKASK